MKRARVEHHRARPVRSARNVSGALALLLAGWTGTALAARPPAAEWRELAPGLETAEIRGDGRLFDQDVEIFLLRADPERWEPVFLCAERVNGGQPLSARDWSAAHDLSVATNAGMFATDGSTHVGYMRCGDDVNSSHVNVYQSVIAFAPRKPELARARIFDLDRTPLSDILVDYASVAQNLRLIQRPGVNRWSPQDRAWSEAALGQDGAGRLIFIFCLEPFSMYELIEILLALPIDLQCAQHLEGGPEAQLHVRCGGFERELVGTFETGFSEGMQAGQAWPIPNALGLRPRAPAGR